MRTLVLFATGLFALGACPTASPAQTRIPDSTAVGAVVLQFHTALSQGDSATALALLAEDAVILEAGGVESRTEYRAHHLPADIRFVMAVPATPGPLQVVVQGDAAWVISTSETTGTYEGRAINSVGAELMVLTRTVRGWQIRAIHWSSRRRATP